MTMTAPRTTAARGLARIVLDTPIGLLAVEGDEQAITHIYLPGSFSDPAPVGGDENAEPLQAARAQLEEYFAGRRRHFDLPLELGGTAFQRQVWTALADIPYGGTISYGELAMLVERPGAARAVGQANGANPIPIVLPCHRVVASAGIGGYGGGLPMKRALLSLEADALTR